MKFIIQDEVDFDFIWTTEQAIKFYEWYNDTNIVKFKCTFNDLSKFLDDGDEFIPVGSVEFVHKTMQIQTGNNNYEPNQVNIPDELMLFKFCGRTCCNYMGQRFINKSSDPIFYKSISKVKGDKGILQPDETLDKGDWFISSLIEFDSEWRGFVFEGSLVDVRLYSGDFRERLDFDLIDEMVSKHKWTYTIDVGTINGKTYLIEVHRFYSCGLYGFNDYTKLLKMLQNGYLELKHLYINSK